MLLPNRSLLMYIQLRVANKGSLKDVMRRRIVRDSMLTVRTVREFSPDSEVTLLPLMAMGKIARFLPE